ncbi:protein translocase subunit SecF [Glutamicibacter soli]|uniref:Protein-export membrane protein SecF n=1 Tax=Glutamicibacter soli TaxID=453836 RepID=A0A365YPJ4_9MICC|nr:MULTISPECIES: protein translocase subunit SecF [Micrococcaceae]ALQ30702.1 preprotein translocase subunit SecF [Arthrobacter sp. YC-RL1]KLI88015.1 preprotein translocase subunit SecF [Arthrobacter sp. YC-RL1]RBM03884.1 protein translocase subunit SecF [Glutamicibacter soli]RKS22887.1 preprotein translocase subunit SecF [Arthrobacter sp. AG1021]
MNKLVTWGNELYTGKRSYPFTSKHRLWFSIAAVLVVLSILLPVVKGGFNLGIDFRGGSEFTVSNTTHTEQGIGEEAVKAVAPEAEATVTNIAPGTMRIQTERLSDDQTLAIAKDLAAGYGVSADEVTSNFIGPTWGQDVSRQALVGLLVFVVLVGLLMAAYFRTWKMSLAAIIGLFTVIIVTGGIYSLTGFEITPSAIIGFLTILSYSLYDTVVVFDKIRENTKDFSKRNERTFEQQVNLAINQTLVRSINTSVVAVLPVASILFIGSYLLGAGTLKDLSLALFVGIIVGTLSTIFVQAPLYAWLRRNDPEVVAHTKKLEAAAA